MSAIYVVTKGHKTGIFRSTKKFHAMITNYPHPRYRVFKGSEKTKAIMYFLAHQQKKGSISYYIDGSLHEKSSRYAYAFVVVDEKTGTILTRCAKAEQKRGFVRDMNIQGVEIQAAMQAVRHAITQKHESINICYDNIIVKDLITGRKSTNHTFYESYRKLVQQARMEHGIRITFCKVKSHSGNRYHDQADQLARDTMRKLNKKNVA